MPINSRQNSDLNLYNEWHADQLATGHYYIPGTAFDDDMEALQVAWEQLREGFMEVWKVEFPGTRPHAWWKFDAPERRLRIDGNPHPFDQPERKDLRLSYGRPRFLTCKDDFMAEYEGELEYLLRLWLIEPEEVKKFQENGQRYKCTRRARRKLLAACTLEDTRIQCQ